MLFDGNGSLPPHPTGKPLTAADDSYNFGRSIVWNCGGCQLFFASKSLSEVSDLFVNIGAVFIGGALGAVARFLLGFVVNQRNVGKFPLGTLVVNLTGTVIIGFLAQTTTRLDPRVLLLADVGFVGAFTTFSSFSYETLILLEQGLYREALLNPSLSLVLGFVGVSAGMLIGSVV